MQLGYCDGMTTTPASLERKVRQMDNDVTSIYEMLSAIQGTQLRHGNRFDELDDRLTSVEGRLTSMEGKLMSMEDKVDGLDDRLTSMEGKLMSMEGKVDGLVVGMQNVLELLRAR